MDRITEPTGPGQFATLHVSKLHGGWLRVENTDCPPELRPMADTVREAIEALRAWRGAGASTLFLHADGRRRWFHDPVRGVSKAAMMEWQAIADRAITDALRVASQTTNADRRE